MTKIILTKEQTEEVCLALHAKLQLCDPDGNVLRTFKHEDAPEFIAELKRRAASPGPWFTSEQVKAHLKALHEEWNRVGGMNRAQVQSFLERQALADPGHFRPVRNSE